MKQQWLQNAESGPQGKKYLATSALKRFFYLSVKTSNLKQKKNLSEKKAVTALHSHNDSLHQKTYNYSH